MKKDAITIQNELEELKKQVAHWKEKYYQIIEQFKLAQQQQYSSSSEKNVLQEELFDEADAPIEEDIPDQKEITVAEHKRTSKPKRPVIPDHFPREVIEHDIPETEKQCTCGCRKERFGEEISEQLDVIPPQFKVIQHVRPKYVCKQCEENISIAPMPNVLLPKSIAASGLVAYTIVAKYIDHLPLYRQEAIWARYGLNIPRNTSCGWIMKASELCEPLIEVLKEDIIASHYIQADETPVQVLKEATQANTKKSYMWVFRGNVPNKTAIYYEYQATRQGLHAKNFLSEFKGYLQTDGYKGYDWVDDTEHITHLGCMTHARRPFAQLVKLAKKTGKAHQAVAFIKQLYAIEKHARENNLLFGERYQLRLEKSKPILDKLKVWLDKTVSGASIKGKLGNAIQYMLDRWDELTNYLKAGYLEIDNNWVENDIRPFAIGKKNWLFAGSPRGAKAGANFYSLIMTCKANGIDPYQYLNYLFNHLRECSTEDDFRKLLPYNVAPEKLAKSI